MPKPPAFPKGFRLKRPRRSECEEIYGAVALSKIALVAGNG